MTSNTHPREVADFEVWQNGAPVPVYAVEVDKIISRLVERDRETPYTVNWDIPGAYPVYYGGNWYTVYTTPPGVWRFENGRWVRDD